MSEQHERPSREPFVLSGTRMENRSSAFATPENRLGYVVDTVRIAQCRRGRKSAFKRLGSVHACPDRLRRVSNQQPEAGGEEGGAPGSGVAVSSAVSVPRRNYARRLLHLAVGQSPHLTTSSQPAQATYNSPPRMVPLVSPIS